jgi:hypothetical protein
VAKIVNDDDNDDDMDSNIIETKIQPLPAPTPATILQSNDVVVVVVKSGRFSRLIGIHLLVGRPVVV